MAIHKNSEFDSNNATTRLLLALWDMGGLTAGLPSVDFGFEGQLVGNRFA